MFTRSKKALFVLLYTEVWECFVRFGSAAILVLYLTKTFKFADSHAYLLYSAYMALYYITPMLGGWIADRLLGNQKAILVGCVLAVLGNGFLVFVHSESLLLGLSLIVLGNGFFLPSLAAVLGELYPVHDRGRDRGFILYYLIKNIGALVAPILCGYIGEYYGYSYAFLLSGAGMLSGLLVFFPCHNIHNPTTHMNKGSKA